MKTEFLALYKMVNLLHNLNKNKKMSVKSLSNQMKVGIDTIQEVKKTRVRTKKENDKLTEYKMNPFVFEKELKIETKTRNLTVGRNTELVRKDEKDDSEESESYFTNIIQQKEVDKEEFIKLFTSQIKVYFDLTKTAYKIFLIVLYL